MFSKWLLEVVLELCFKEAVVSLMFVLVMTCLACGVLSSYSACNG